MNNIDDTPFCISKWWFFAFFCYFALCNLLYFLRSPRLILFIFLFLVFLYFSHYFGDILIIFCFLSSLTVHITFVTNVNPF